MLTRGNLPGGKWLSPRIKILWYIEMLPLAAAVLMVAYLLFYVLAPFFTGPKSDFSYDAAFLLISVIAIFAPYFAAELKYRKFIYAFNDNDLIIKKGIIEKIRYVIPYEKIQNVNISRSIAEGILGLGTLHIETAAHKSLEEDVILPGIENYNDVVNELMELSEKAKKTGVKHDDEYHTTMVQLLARINEQLMLLNRAVNPESKREKTKTVPKKRDMVKEISEEPLFEE
jgi:uncharacterized membrane protein YdbT with pleckstrin-like domain